MFGFETWHSAVELRRYLLRFLRLFPDRPPVAAPGTVNLAFVGQYVEIPENVVYTVEYSIHSAALAVATLLGAPHRVPAAYREGMLMLPRGLPGK